MWIVPVDLIPKLVASLFANTSFFSEVLTARSLARHNPIEAQFSQQLQHSCRRYFRLKALFSASYLVVLQHLQCGNRSALQPHSVFRELTSGRMPILTTWYRTTTFQKASARLSKNSASLTSASGASSSRRTSTSCHEGGAPFGVGFGARSSLSCRKLHWSPFEHWSFSFHW